MFIITITLSLDFGTIIQIVIILIFITMLPLNKPLLFSYSLYDVDYDVITMLMLSQYFTFACIRRH